MPPSKRFANDLQKLLDLSHEDARDLRLALNRGALGSGTEAVAMSSSLLEDVAELNGQLPQLALVAEQVPSATDIVRAAKIRLSAIDAVLDKFELKLKDIYDIAPVVLPPLAELADVHTPAFDPAVMRDVTGLSDSNSNFRVQRAPGLDSEKEAMLPCMPANSSHVAMSARKPGPIDAPMPSTPKLVDFGIPNEFQDGVTTPSLQLHRSSHQVAPSAFARSVDLSPIPARDAADYLVDDEEETFDELVQNSMAALGIETPDELAKRFAIREQQSSAAAVAAMTPAMKCARMESRKGAASAIRKVSTAVPQQNRTLNFENTPRAHVRSHRRCTVLQKRIEDGYRNLPPYLLQKVDCEVLQDTASAIEAAGAGQKYTAVALSDVIENTMPNAPHRFITLALTKLKVLSLEKAPGVPVTYMLAL